MMRAASILLMAGLLASCTRLDGIIGDTMPPETVGALPAQTSAPPVAAAPQQGVARQNLAPPSGSAPQTYAARTQQNNPAAPQQAYPPARNPAYDATPGVGRAPSTFGAQAANLAPAAPVYTPPPQQAKAVAQTPAGQQPTPQASAAPPAATRQATASAAPAASIAAADTLRFLPIIGAPGDKLEPLSARLGESARAAGLSIVSLDDAAADLSLKGYFSAVDQDGVVSVIYVWDVIGANGARLHRIQDSEASQTGGFAGSDPWAGVSAEMMATIGQKSIGSLLAWLDTQS